MRSQVYLFFQRIGTGILLILAFVFLASEFTPATEAGKNSGKKDAHPGETKSGDKSPEVPPPSASAAQIATGYRVQVILSNLTYPSSVELDDRGNLYVAEAGYAYGDPKAKPRIMQRRLGGAFEAVIADGLEGPVTDLLWYQNKLYISHRGKISTWQPGGKLTDLVTGLPSLGDHHNNQMAVGPDGKIYFGQGTATNSGVVGEDNFKMGWLKKHPKLHDFPANDIVLSDARFKSSNPLSNQESDTSATSAFHPFGKNAKAGAVVHGITKANGTILRINPDGSGLEVYASGLRNPYGLAWGMDGKLYASENGFDVRGSRPIANDLEDIYRIKQGAWYGWPDYASGIPVTDARFQPEKGPAPQFLLKRHPPVEKPLFTFPKHDAITQMEFCRSKQFGFEGHLFVAFFGHMTPMTGKPPKEHGGHRVMRIDLASGKTETFFGRKEHSHQGEKTYAKEVKEADNKRESQSHNHHEEGGVTPGPRRLVDVRFSPSGDVLYVVDFGAMIVTEEGSHPIRGTGVLWQIIRDDKGIITP
jgi:glucose/arabinose dehydrogenase